MHPMRPPYILRHNNIDIGAPRASDLQAAASAQASETIKLPPEVQPNDFLNNVETVSIADAYKN